MIRSVHALLGSGGSVEELEDQEILLWTNFVGTTINTGIGTVTNPDVANLTINQLNRLRFVRTTDNAVASAVTNNWTSVDTFPKGSFVAAILNKDNGFDNSLFTFRWVFDANNLISIQRVSSTSVALIVVDNGVTVYNNTPSINPNNRFKISYASNNEIKFYYWNVNTWTQIGTTQTFDLGTEGNIFFSSSSSASDAAGHIFSFGQLRITNEDYATRQPEDRNFFDILNSSKTRYVGNPILTNDGTHTNTCPAGVITDPMDDTKFLFYRGEFLGHITVGAQISVFEGDISDPFTMTPIGIVLQGSESYDINGCRFGCVLTRSNGTVYYYYVGIDASFKWRICLATSTDGRTFTKQGVVLDFNNVDEKSVSDPSVVYYNGTLYMIYTVWDGLTSPPNNNPGESKLGIKLATSTNWTSWTKTGTTLIPLGSSGAYDDNNVEGGQLLKFGPTWSIMYNCNDGSKWQIAIAYSEEINAAFVKNSAIYFSDSVTGWDDALVACPLYHDFNGTGVMYYQAATSPNPDEEEDIGAVTIH